MVKSDPVRHDFLFTNESFTIARFHCTTALTKRKYSRFSSEKVLCILLFDLKAVQAQLEQNLLEGLLSGEFILFGAHSAST